MSEEIELRKEVIEFMIKEGQEIKLTWTVTQFLMV